MAVAQALVGKLGGLRGLVEGEVALGHDQIKRGCAAVDAQAALGGADGALIVARLIGRLGLAHQAAQGAAHRSVSRRSGTCWAGPVVGGWRCAACTGGAVVRAAVGAFCFGAVLPYLRVILACGHSVTGDYPYRFGAVGLWVASGWSVGKAFVSLVWAVVAGAAAEG